MRQPIGEKDQVVLLPRLPLEAVGLLELDECVTHLLPSKGQHLWGCVDRCQFLTKWEQSVCPGASSACQFEHLLNWRKLLQEVSGSRKCTLQIFGLARRFVVFLSHLSIVGNLLVKDVLIHHFPLFLREGPLFSHEVYIAGLLRALHSSTPSQT